MITRCHWCPCWYETMPTDSICTGCGALLEDHTDKVLAEMYAEEMARQHEVTWMDTDVEYE
jgi:hypothetical protein